MKPKNNGLYNPQDLEARTVNYSSYDGGFYDGSNDDFLDFGGNAGTFGDAVNSGKIYTITLKNNSTSATLIALLCPGLIRNAVGLMADGGFTDYDDVVSGGGSTGLVGAGGPQPIAYFNAFIDKFPTTILGFKVSTNNPVQLDQIITIQRQSPFKNYSSRLIQIGIYADPINPNTTLLNIPEKFYMDGQTQIQYPILASTTVSLVMAFGASLNIATALRTKDSVIQNNKVAAVAGALPTASFRGLGR